MTRLSPSSSKPSSENPRPIADRPWHALSIADVASALNCDSAQGLKNDEVPRRREQSGTNELRAAPDLSWWRRFLAQFADLVVWILIVAAIIAGALGEWVDTVVILAIVVVNAMVGFFQEERANRALAALRQMASPLAKVRRDGRLQTVPARDLVPGDRIELEAGDHVHADARLCEAFALRAQESALTGESVPVDKLSGDTLPEKLNLAQRHNMVYSGTVVAAGKGSALVVATGMSTQLGQIASLLERAPREPTPLERRLEELGKVLVGVCLAIVAVIFSLEMWRGGKLVEVFLVAISLAVAAVPEGLPAVVTLSLALGLLRMARRNALVRKLPSVETLGAVTVICSDKTGTLTRNEMTVRELVTADAHYQVTGSGYEPRGQILAQAAVPAGSADTAPQNPPSTPAATDSSDPVLHQLLTIAALCNNAGLRLDEASGRWLITGDPTEAALLVAARKFGIEPRASNDRLLHEIPFDSERKAMSVVIARGEGPPRLFTKGATEVVLAASSRQHTASGVRQLTAEARNAILQAAEQMASRALRVLALADRHDAPGEPTTWREEQLVFAGLVGMIDPPRDEVRAAVRQCRHAGIRPVMITGDHPATARAIARELGIADDRDRTLGGEELSALDDQQLLQQVDQVSVYARVEAEHKLRVVSAWQRRGQVVAMTGDGVNDAPAVRAADIGIAMGITGTDVTKEASDMVLIDDNFASIVNAVEEGRGIYDNIQNVVHYLLSCNAGEVLLMFFAAVVGWPVPLRPGHLLWINLVTDGLPALALGTEPPERNVMQRPPRAPGERILSSRRGLLILAHGTLIGAVAAAAFWHAYEGNSKNLVAARTSAFCVMALSQLAFSLGCRSRSGTLFQVGPWTNPALVAALLGSAALQFLVVGWPRMARAFDVAMPSSAQWLPIVGLALVPVTVLELGKLATTWWKKSKLPAPSKPDA